MTSPVRCIPCRHVFGFELLHRWTVSQLKSTCPNCRKPIEKVELMSKTAVDRWNQMETDYKAGEAEEQNVRASEEFKALLEEQRILKEREEAMLRASKAKQAENAFAKRFKTKLRLKF